MLKTATSIPEAQQFILSDLSPGPVQVRLALIVVFALLGLFVLISFGPLAGVRLSKIEPFVPVYATAMFVCDSITAVLLLAQFSILRSRAILLIATGYLFTALILIPWVMVFPGFFVPTGGLVGGPQSTSWLWFTQHAGFSLFVLAYALTKDADCKRTVPGRAQVRSAIDAKCRMVSDCLVAVAIALICIEWAALPPVTLTSL